MKTLRPAILALPLLLSACGGGGGGGSSAPATPSTPPPPPCIRVAGNECLELSTFLSRRDSIATRKTNANEYVPQRTFPLVNMAQAHAAIELLHGADAVPGAGVRVAVLDSGFGTDDDMHNGVDHYLFDGVDVEVVEVFKGAEVNENKEHGLNVASIVAGARVQECALGFSNTCTGSETGSPAYVGVAPGVDLDVYAYSLGDPQTGQTRPTDAVRLPAALSTVLRRSSPHIVNMSFGIPEIFVENYDEMEIRSLFSGEIAARRQTGNDPTIFVQSAGNDNTDPCNPDGMDVQNCIDDPDVPNVEDDPDTPDNEAAGGNFDATSPSPDAALMVHIEELRGYTVVVVATASTGEIANYSNRCGVAAQWCIAAPGFVAHSAEFSATGEEISLFSLGTSFSAPIVSGSLALMRHFFRGQLSNRELLSRMFAMADKSGRYSDRDIYGQGMLDIGAAISPAGTPLLGTGTAPVVAGAAAAAAGQAGQGGNGGDSGNNGNNGNGGQTPGSAAVGGIDTSRIRLGHAFGDGLQRALQGQEIAAFDALGAPFWFQLSDFVHTAKDYEQDSSHSRRSRRVKYHEPGSWLHTLRQTQADTASGLLNPHPGNHHLSMPLSHIGGGSNTDSNDIGSHSGWTFTAFTNNTQQRGQQARQGAALSWQSADAGYGVHLGMVNEPGSLLGSRTSDAFGRVAARSGVLGFEWQQQWRGWQLRADTEWGFVDGDAYGGLLRGMSGVTTSAATLRGSRPVGQHSQQVMFALSQPPRVEQGHLKLQIPVGRTIDGQILQETLNAALSPSKRQIDFTAHWRHSNVWGGELRLSALYSHNPGHISGPGEAGFLLTYNASF